MTAEAPLLSVILPNFNHGASIDRAIDALLEQDRTADEIIIIDDASTDESRLVIERYAAESPSIRAYFHEVNRGAIYTLQRGLEMARGKYVYLAAADDYTLPGFFAAALGLLEQYPDVGLCCADTVVLDGRLGHVLGFRPLVRPCRRRGVLSPADVEQLLKRADNFILTGSSLLRRDVALAMGGLDGNAGSFADGLLVRKIALRQGLCFLPIPAATWNIFPGGLSRTTALRGDLVLNALTSIPNRIAHDPQFPSWYAETFKRRWRFASARLLLQSEPPDRALIQAVAAPTALDRYVIAVLLWLAPLALRRLVTLAWLTLRFRPYRLRDVAITRIDRLLEHAAIRRRCH